MIEILVVTQQASESVEILKEDTPSPLKLNE